MCQFKEFSLYITEAEDCEFLTPEATLDEHSPKATRTLFLGNLEKEITIEELKERLEKYGEILVSLLHIKRDQILLLNLQKLGVLCVCHHFLMIAYMCNLTFLIVNSYSNFQ